MWLGFHLAIGHSLVIRNQRTSGREGGDKPEAEESVEINTACGNFSFTSAALSTGTRNLENDTPKRRLSLQEGTGWTPWG